MSGTSFALTFDKAAGSQFWDITVLRSESASDEDGFEREERPIH